MASNVFYNGIIRKLVVGFGSIFDNITLVRTNSDGTENQRIDVPIIFAGKEKYIARLMGDPDLDKKVQIVLPRMSFDILGMSYDASRKQQTTIKNYAPTATDPTSAKAQYVPVPYDFDFELYIYVRSIEDGAQIVEHILPYFTPEYTIKLNLVPSMNITREIPIRLNSVKYENQYEGDRESATRMVIYTLDFTVKGYVFGPTATTGIIRESITNILNLALLNEPTVKFNMANTGFGVYKTGEFVYQGLSFDLATATAKVVAYSNTTNVLEVNQLGGDFKSNTMVIGFDSNAEFVLNSFLVPPPLMVKIDATITPNTANINTPHTVTVNIKEQ